MAERAPHEVEPAIALRRVDHYSLTVPDLDGALQFFVEVLGARELYRRSFTPGADRTDMPTRFNAHPDASFRMAKLDLAGCALELFEYSSPDTTQTTARNCDPGGSHLALEVDDMDAAVERLGRVPGVSLLGLPSVIEPPHPLAGRRWVYFLTPWRYQLELVTPPHARSESTP